MDYPETMGQSKPHLHIESDALPELKDAKIGDEFTLEVKVRVKELRSASYDMADRKDIVCADLCIDAIKVKEGGEGK